MCGPGRNYQGGFSNANGWFPPPEILIEQIWVLLSTGSFEIFQQYQCAASFETHGPLTLNHHSILMR